MTAFIREFRSDDATDVNRVALAAWDQYRGLFSDWPRSEAILANAAGLAASADMLVAEKAGSIVGYVLYVGPGRDREPVFEPTWSIMRMLSVDPVARGQGIGRQLSEACIERARRDGAKVVGLHSICAGLLSLGFTGLLSSRLDNPARLGMERDAGSRLGAAAPREEGLQGRGECGAQFGYQLRKGSRNGSKNVLFEIRKAS
jgi:predicted N-acetyltransferase YhbS